MQGKQAHVPIHCSILQESECGVQGILGSPSVCGSHLAFVDGFLCYKFRLCVTVACTASWGQSHIKLSVVV